MARLWKGCLFGRETLTNASKALRSATSVFSFSTAPITNCQKPHVEPARRSSTALACTNGFKPQTIRHVLFAETFFNVVYYCRSTYFANCLTKCGVITQLFASPLWQAFFNISLDRRRVSKIREVEFFS